MSKMSKIAVVAAIAASIAAPALAQTRYQSLYDYYPGAAWPYYSNHPAATGGGSAGYNENLIFDDR